MLFYSTSAGTSPRQQSTLETVVTEYAPIKELDGKYKRDAGW